MEEFNNLINILRENGFFIEVQKDKIYDFVTFDGNNVIGGFCSKHDAALLDASYSYINGKIAVDNTDCFDKWSKCPLNLKIPKTEKQIKYLLDQLKYWGSSEGYNDSNGYEFEKWVGEYPELLR